MDFENFSNKDVQWEGNFLGLSPSLIGKNAKQLLKNGEQSIPYLLESLSNSDKFVAAHVILTYISKVEYTTYPTWNTMAVIIMPDGTVNIDLEQRHTLAYKWKKWYNSNPRPKTLS